jgi:Zn-dependent protease
MDFDFSLGALRNGLILYIIFIASLCIREWARAWTVDRLGDPNPAAQGRVTLNPVAHIDLIGSIILPLISIVFFQSSFLIGWGKPVTPNPAYFANPKRGEIIAALAGPAANLGVALIASVVMAIAYRFDPATEQLYRSILSMSVLLAVFNLMPLPPLDGGVLLKHLTGMSEELYLRLSQWSLILWLILISIKPVQFILLLAMGYVALPFKLMYLIFR